MRLRLFAVRQLAPLPRGSGLRCVPALLGLRCLSRVQQRLQLLRFVLPLFLGRRRVQVVMLQRLQGRPQLALFVRLALGVQGLGLLGL